MSASNEKRKAFMNVFGKLLLPAGFVVHGKESDFTESSISGTTVMKTFFDVLYVRYGLLYPRR